MDGILSAFIAVRLIRDNWKAVIRNYPTSLIGEILFDLQDKQLLGIILLPLLARFSMICRMWVFLITHDISLWGERTELSFWAGSRGLGVSFCLPLLWALASGPARLFFKPHQYIYIYIYKIDSIDDWGLLDDLYLYHIREKNLLSENRKLPGGNKFYYAYRKAFSFLKIERIQLGTIVYITSIHQKQQSIMICLGHCSETKSLAALFERVSPNFSCFCKGKKKQMQKQRRKGRLRKRKKQRENNQGREKQMRE